MLISSLLAGSKEVLGNCLEGEILLAFLLKKGREHLIANPELNVDSETAAKFEDMCAKRARGLPIAYLTNHKEFYGLDFFVDERVLIPRPETEILVEEVLKRARGLGNLGHAGRGVRFCDVGTGSGCIAVSVAKNMPSAKIVAVDVSDAALEVAKKNAMAHGVEKQIEFIEGDLMTGILDREFDGILANLPYVGRGERDSVEKDVVENEPHGALFGGETGPELFEKLFTQIAQLKHKPVWIIGEMGSSQKEVMTGLIKKYFVSAKTKFINDLAGLPRTFVVDL